MGASRLLEALYIHDEEDGAAGAHLDRFLQDGAFADD